MWFHNTVNLQLLALGLYKGGGGGLYTGGLYMDDLLQVSHKQENKHVLITRFD
jgi:hypothetical protein